VPLLLLAQSTKDSGKAVLTPTAVRERHLVSYYAGSVPPKLSIRSWRRNNSFFHPYQLNPGGL